jgi:arylsulfatase A-like enzyme
VNCLWRHLIAGWVTCLLAIHCIDDAAAERPNVLFISLDDMNDWLGCYGGHPDAKTPNIDSLAKRGIVFTNAHCVSPICGPSRAAVLTGMRPETTGVYHNRGQYIDYVPDAVTFPEHFRASGYLAMAAGKVNHGLGEPDPRLWDQNGPDCGVLGTPFVGDELHTVKMTPERIIDRGTLKITLPANGGLSAIDRPNNTWDSFDWAPLDCPETDFPDRKIADWGVEQLQQRHDKPFLMALGFYKPHQPFFAPRRYFDLYDPKTISLPPTIAGDLHDVPPPGRELATQPWTSGTHKTVATHGAWRDAVRAYLATVSFVDSLVGRVIEALDNSPHADNTWIILWSDHGWSLGEKEHWGKHAPWRETVRMPLMIVPPNSSTPRGFEAGSRSRARVSLLDLYPTLLDACSLPARAELEGKSLLPLIANPLTDWDAAVVSTVGRGTHSVRTQDWRYIRYFDGSEELYDLRHDPREWFNLANHQEHAQLKQQLARDIPEDDRLKQFVRWGRWKCVFPVEGKPMLFDYHGEFGISEQNDLASEYPEVIAKIIRYLTEEQITARRVTMPDHQRQR